MLLTDRNKLLIAFGAAVAVVVTDQVIKYLVRIYIGDGPNVEVTPWFYLCYVENNGMAFGISIFNKLFLTVFRVFSMFFLGYLVTYLVRKKYSFGMVMGFAMVLAGAVGNIIDCVFYAKLFDGGGWGYGKVVDMFFFPLIRGTFPDWFPLWGGERFVFFRPVFNFADAAITTGVFYLMFFRWRELGSLFETLEQKKEKEDDKNEE